MKYIWLTVFIFSITLVRGQGLKVEVSGNINFPSTQFSITEAGDDFPSSLESESLVNMSVLYNDYSNRKINPNQKWRVQVNKADVFWNSDLDLEIIRTGNGERVNSNGSPNINDGTNYQQVTNLPTYFFRGRDEIAYIPVKFKVSGFSITMGAVNYETNIVFTVYED